MTEKIELNVNSTVSNDSVASKLIENGMSTVKFNLAPFYQNVSPLMLLSGIGVYSYSGEKETYLPF